MTRVRTLAVRRLAVLCTGLSACLAVTGCSLLGLLRPPSSQGAGAAHTTTGQALSPPAAMQRVALGQSRKAEVAAALGPAIVISFDSGYEVWVYRWPGADRTPRAATELVLLFDPAGVLTKARVRPGVASSD